MEEKQFCPPKETGQFPKSVATVFVFCLPFVSLALVLFAVQQLRGKASFKRVRLPASQTATYDQVSLSEIPMRLGR